MPPICARWLENLDLPSSWHWLLIQAMQGPVCVSSHYGTIIKTQISLCFCCFQVLSPCLRGLPWSPQKLCHIIPLYVVLPVSTPKPNSNLRSLVLFKSDWNIPDAGLQCLITSGWFPWFCPHPSLMFPLLSLYFLFPAKILTDVTVNAHVHFHSSNMC